MALSINVNMAALNTQRNLGKSESLLNTSMERLSTGLRINSAKDDVAGVAIADRMGAQIRGMNQASRNANDAISLAQTAEGALQESTSILQRMRELAVQSANDTNTDSDRAKIQKEITSLTSELDRIATTTQFNGKALFDGNFGVATYQVGANANETINASINNFRTQQYGNYQITGTATAASSATRTVSGKAIVVNGSITSGTYTTATGDTAKTIAEGINKLGTGVTASARTEIDISFGTAGSYSLSITSDNTTAKTVSLNLAAVNTSDGLAAAAKAFNDASGETGVTAKVNSGGTKITLVNATGNDITVANATGVTNAGTMVIGAGASGTLATNGTSTIINGQVTLDSDKGFNATDAGTSGYSIAAASSTLQKVSTLSVSSAANATSALKIIDSALSAVSDQRANFGALQNRMTSVINNLQNVSENLTSAQSRIQDADFAKETGSMSRGQILQQAGLAMLSQANQSQQGVLSLLR